MAAGRLDLHQNPWVNQGGTSEAKSLSQKLTMFPDQPPIRPRLLDENSEPPLRAILVKPRIWTVFVVFVLALVAVLLIQSAVGIVLAIWYIARGAGPDQAIDQVMSLLTNPIVFIFLVVVTEIVIGAAALAPGCSSSEPPVQRLGLGKPKLPLWGYPVVVVASLVPYTVGIALFYGLGLFFDADPYLGQVFAESNGPLAIPVALCVAIPPGVMEELLFRGYMQRRLLKRWSAWGAILVCSFLFAVFHMMPHTVLFAFAVGIWLGVLAWRTDSIWPSVLCHASINTFSSIWALSGWNPFADWRWFAAIAAGAVVCFAVSVWLLARPVRGASPANHGEMFGARFR